MSRRGITRDLLPFACVCVLGIAEALQFASKEPEDEDAQQPHKKTLADYTTDELEAELARRKAEMFPLLKSPLARAKGPASSEQHTPAAPKNTARAPRAAPANLQACQDIGGDYIDKNANPVTVTQTSCNVKIDVVSGGQLSSKQGRLVGDSLHVEGFRTGARARGDTVTFSDGGLWKRQEMVAHKGAVCLSIAAFEESMWIDALLTNALRMMEPSTVIAIHLNAKTQYDNETLARWDQLQRVILNPSRVEVEVFHGSILYSHLSNTKVLPKSCKYVVLQASNVMWVRGGMEDVVRKHEFGGFSIVEGRGLNEKQLRHEFFANLTRIGSAQFAWGIHEGSFYRTDTVNKFTSYIDAWLADENLTLFESVLDGHGPFEEYWLQTYTVNTENKTDMAPALTFRDIFNMDNTISIEDVLTVRRGQLPSLCTEKPRANPCVAGSTTMPEEGFFSVKRVARNVHDPVTGAIMKMTP